MIARFLIGFALLPLLTAEDAQACMRCRWHRPACCTAVRQCPPTQAYQTPRTTIQNQINNLQAQIADIDRRIQAGLPLDHWTTAVVNSSSGKLTIYSRRLETLIHG